MTPRVAIVHDALVNAGGAERVVTYMCEAFPDAPVFTSAYLPHRTYDAFRARDVRTMPAAGLVRSEAGAKLFLPVWLWGFRRLDLSSFDVVLSSSTFGARHAHAAPGARHVAYCYAPFRLLWNPEAYASSSLPLGRVGQAAIGLAGPWLRQFDREAVTRADAVATTCRNMASAIKTAYGRDVDIIHAPIRLADYRMGHGAGDYYLSVSRLISHKRVDVAVQACTQLGRRLVVVGDGPERARLQQRAGASVSFAGRVDDDTLCALYAGCKALLFCSDEDYGLAPLEAQASGRPVIAFGSGGALETVRDGETGLFFAAQHPEVLVEAIQAFERRSFDPNRVRAHAKHFDVEPFIANLKAWVYGSDHPVSALLSHALNSNNLRRSL